MKTTIPSSPFVRPYGDVILRSSDGQDFFVVKAILTIASSFFQSLFSLPPPEDQNNIPTISVSEDSTTLDTLLRICYPVRAPVVTDLELAEAVLAAALKYEMEIGIQEMCRVLVSEKSLDTQAVRVYAIACRHKLVEEARAAAIASLRGPIEDIYVNEFETLPTVYYFLLLKFQRRARSDICKVLDDALNGCQNPDADPIRCRCPSQARPFSYSNTHVSCWESFIRNRVRPAASVAPDDPTLFSLQDLNNCLFELEHRPTANSCQDCKSSLLAQWPLAVASLRAMFDKKISEAAVELRTF